MSYAGTRRQPLMGFFVCRAQGVGASQVGLYKLIYIIALLIKLRIIERYCTGSQSNLQQKGELQ